MRPIVNDADTTAPAVGGLGGPLAHEEHFARSHLAPWAPPWGRTAAARPCSRRGGRPPGSAPLKTAHYNTVNNDFGVEGPQQILPPTFCNSQRPRRPLEFIYEQVANGAFSSVPARPEVVGPSPEPFRHVGGRLAATCVSVASGRMAIQSGPCVRARCAHTCGLEPARCPCRCDHVIPQTPEGLGPGLDAPPPEELGPGLDAPPRPRPRGLTRLTLPRVAVPRGSALRAPVFLLISRYY